MQIEKPVFMYVYMCTHFGLLFKITKCESVFKYTVYTHELLFFFLFSEKIKHPVNYLKIRGKLKN